MDFGADTNAHTAYDETVYTLTLPAADEKTLAEGLTVLADFARGALLRDAPPEERFHGACRLCRYGRAASRWPGSSRSTKLTRS